MFDLPAYTTFADSSLPKIGNEVRWPRPQGADSHVRFFEAFNCELLCYYRICSSRMWLAYRAVCASSALDDSRALLTDTRPWRYRVVGHFEVGCRPQTDPTNAESTQDRTPEILDRLASKAGTPMRVEQGEWRDDFS